MKFHVFPKLGDKVFMIELFKRKSSKQTSLADKRQFLFAHFINDANHQWLKEYQGLQTALFNFISAMNEEQLAFFCQNKIYLIPCQAKLSCAIGKTGNDQIVLIFPEMLEMLKRRQFTHAFAILAHELGHIFFNHTEKRTETFKAQLEADYFAVSMGLGHELIDILLEHPHLEECRVRINYIKKFLVKLDKKEQLQ